MKSRSNRQLILPGFGGNRALDDSSVTVRLRLWYYLVNPRKQEMLALDDGGNEVWIPHDCQRSYPHLFSTRTNANLAKQRYPKTCVMTYQFSKHNDYGRY